MVFTHFKNRDNQHHRYTNTIRTFFLAFYIIRVCVDSIFILFLNFFLLYIGSLSNLFLITFLSLSQISLYFSSSFLPFIKKDIFSLIKISSICTQFWQHYKSGHNFFNIIFVLNKVFKTFFTKGELTRYYYSINVLIIYQNFVFVLVKYFFFNFSVAKCYSFFMHFICGNNFLKIFVFIIILFLRSN